MFENSKDPFYPKYDWERLQNCLRKVVSWKELLELRKTDWYRHLFHSSVPITEEEILNRPWEKWGKDDGELPF